MPRIDCWGVCAVLKQVSKPDCVHSFAWAERIEHVDHAVNKYNQWFILLDDFHKILSIVHLHDASSFSIGGLCSAMATDRGLPLDLLRR